MKGTKKPKKWNFARVEAADYALLRKQAKVRGMSVPGYLHLLINKE